MTADPPRGPWAFQPPQRRVTELCTRCTRPFYDDIIVTTFELINRL